MKVLAYDVETSGIPLWGKPSDDPEQPRVCQLAAELFDDETGRTIHAMNFIIRPVGWQITEETARVHGITMERACQHGVLMAAVLPMFTALWRQCDIRCAHNEQFDARMLRIEYLRTWVGPELEQGLADEWKAAPAFCTQAKSSPVLNLPPTERMLAAGRTHAKSPNLAEAYQFFTGRPLENAHDAWVDVQACKAVYMALKEHSA